MIHISTYASGRLAIASIYSEDGLRNRALNSNELKPVDVLAARWSRDVACLVCDDERVRVALPRCSAEVERWANAGACEGVRNEVVLAEHGVGRAKRRDHVVNGDGLVGVEECESSNLKSIEKRCPIHAREVEQLSNCSDGSARFLSNLVVWKWYGRT